MRTRDSGVVAAALVGLTLWLVLRDDDERRRPSAHDARRAKERVREGKPVLAVAPAPTTPPATSGAAAARTAEPGEVASPAATRIDGRLRHRRMPAGAVRVRAVPRDGGDASPWAESSADGTFRLDGLDPARRYRLVARVGPLAPEVEVAPDVAPGGDRVELDLPGATEAAGAARGAGVRGRVRIVGHDGGAVARAAVAIGTSGFGGFVDVVDGAFVRSADEPWGTTYEVFAPRDAQGEPLPYGPASRRFGEDDAHAEATIVLPRERRVEARVVASDGSGVAGVEVHAAPGEGPVVHARATSDARGAFVLRNLGARPYRLHAKPPSPWRPQGEWALDGEATETVLRLARGVTVAVRVVDPDGNPVVGAFVHARPRDGLPHPQPGDRGSRVTDGTGTVRLEALDPEGVYDLHAAPPLGQILLVREPSVPDGPWLRTGALRPAVRAAWTPADTVVALEAGYAVTGVVRDSSGAPVAGLVRRRLPDGTFQPFVGAMPDGTFHASGLAAGPLTLAASRDSVAATGPEVSVEAGATGVVLVVPDEPAAGDGR